MPAPSLEVAVLESGHGVAAKVPPGGYVTRPEAGCQVAWCVKAADVFVEKLSDTTYAMCQA